MNNNIDFVDISDLNILYPAYRAAFKSSPWKEQSQKFQLNEYGELTKLQKQLRDHTYRTSKGHEFVISERGKRRYIHSSSMADKTVRHALCDNILYPAIQKYLIHDNGASQKGKGISFTRANFERDLHNFYLKYGDNKGYVGFIDMSKFYDNIQHDKVKELLYPLIPHEYHWLMDEVLKSFEIDVSYMSKEDYDECLDKKFDSLEYHANIPDELKTGEKMMRKSVDIGDQVSQIIGIFYPSRLDNYAKIVRGCKAYGRYMDDIRIICRTKEELKSIMNGIAEEAEKLGLFINTKKTRICKLSSTFTYLQVKYTLTKRGKVIKSITHEAIKRERDRIKAYGRLVAEGKITYAVAENAYKSWLGSFKHIMSEKQIINMNNVFIKTFGRKPIWKKER